MRRFHFRELQIATNNFSSKKIIGKGGFGHVYKGILLDGSVVAVKRLLDGNAKGGEIQFQTEIEMISLAVHRNLLKLYGFCITPTEKLLVYPFMPNGSVASRLKGIKAKFFMSLATLWFSKSSSHISSFLFLLTEMETKGKCFEELNWI